MTRLLPKPIIHGRDHGCGGADEIPGICDLQGLIGNFSETVVEIPNLFAYWRLGETAGPWLDSSGLAPAADLIEQGSGTAPTTHVTGALSGNDDGAIEFNYDGSSETGGRYLYNAASKDFDMGPNGQLTVAAWVKVKASTATRRGIIVGNPIHAIAAGDHIDGWGLQVVYPGRTVRFSRGHVSFPGPEIYVETSAGVVADQWNLFVGSYDGAEIRLYANGGLVGSLADTSNAPLIPHNLKIGTGGIPADGTNNSWFYGSVDEVAIWSRAITSDEVAELYGSSGSGVVGPPGATGATGATGAAGPGVATGGTTGQVLTKTSGTDYATNWQTPSGGDPATDTKVWMPLFDSDGSVVFDDTDELIPTLIPLA